MKKDNTSFAENCKEAKRVITDFTEKYILPNQDTNPSWRYLVYHSQMCLAYAGLAIAGATHDEAEYATQTEIFKTLLKDLRPYTHRVFDPRVANQIYESFLKKI